MKEAHYNFKIHASFTGKNWFISDDGGMMLSKKFSMVPFERLLAKDNTSDFMWDSRESAERFLEEYQCIGA